ncbi:MAG: glycosyltransferase family 1 protein [Pedosphaera sp.]|nr:glycosyltransferase family 1 protein [Pedosphaera sp.]
MQVLVVTCGAAHLPQIARALQKRDTLAGLWISYKNRVGIAPEKFRRAWIFHLAVKPFYHLTSPANREKAHHFFFPLWRFWLHRQQPPPFDAVHALLGYGTEPFDFADKTGALKVIDASSSHPTSSYGFWQRECDLWCPGAEPGVPRWIFARANRDVERADVILCPSNFVRDSMLYNGIAESKCVVNPYGVDTSTFTPRETVPTKPRFICVGAIGLRKGYQYLFRAFEKVRRVLPEAELVCAGNYFNDFRLERPRWQGTFTHCQNLPHTELSKLLRTSTAFVFPSNEEGFARAVVEAMASGLPIIATHESGATTLVNDGVEGLIVKARGVDQLAAAMIKLATDRALNERMGRAAHVRGAQKNSWDDYTGRLLQIYGEAIARKKAAGPAAQS